MYILSKYLDTYFYVVLRNDNDDNGQRKTENAYEGCYVFRCPLLEIIEEEVDSVLACNLRVFCFVNFTAWRKEKKPTL